MDIASCSWFGSTQEPDRVRELRPCQLRDRQLDGARRAWKPYHQTTFHDAGAGAREPCGATDLTVRERPEQLAEARQLSVQQWNHRLGSAISRRHAGSAREEDRVGGPASQGGTKGPTDRGHLVLDPCPRSHRMAHPLEETAHGV